MLGAVAAAWAWNLTQVPMLANDDAFVFVRYARHWVEHGCLEWNACERGTDGYTSLLHLLLLSGAHGLLRGDPVSAAWWVCLGASTLSLAGMPALPALWARRRGQPWPAALLAGALASLPVAALSPRFAYWTHSLMDAATLPLSLLGASLASATLCCAREGRLRFAWAGVALGLFAWARPEALLVGWVILGLAALRLAPDPLRRRTGLAPATGVARPLAAGLLIAGLLSGGYFGWHLLRYGHAFPNPVYVKTSGPGPEKAIEGLAYLLRGPGSGNLPTGLVRPDGRRVTAGPVHATLSPERPAAIHLALLALWPLGWAATGLRGFWAEPAAAARLRAFLLPSTGMLGLLVLAGGDSFYAGWRMPTPLLPALLLAPALALPALRRPARLAVWALLLLLALPGLAALPRRPSLCRASGAACGLEALASWPTTLESYAWDHTHAHQDVQVARALAATFPPDTLVGQSDFLRIGAHLENPILDLSGLVNAELAHAPHPPKVSLFQLDLVWRTQPELFFLWWGFVSERSLAETGLAEEGRHQVLRPAERRYTPTLRRRLRRLSRDYLGASVRLEDGRFFNFLVHRAAVAKMRTRELVSVEAVR